MAVYNGGTITSIPSYYRYMTRYQRQLLLKHRAKHFHHIADMIIRSTPELPEMLEFVKNEVSENWYKTIRGHLVWEVMVRYVIFCLNPQHYAHRGDLIFYANYVHLQQYLQRIVSVLINEYNYPHKYHPFKINGDRLYKMSCIFADELIPYTQKVLLPHWEKIKDIPSKDKWI